MFNLLKKEINLKYNEDPVCTAQKTFRLSH
jgi:hypothetical protein